MKPARRWIVALGFLVWVQARAVDFSAHGYLDCRLIARAGEQSWADGGLGKTRFGDGGFGAACVQGGVTARAQLTPALSALAEVQYQTTDHNSFSALEAYLRYRPVSTTPWRWSVKVGEFFPPISLENDAIGWTSPWTITPSAINGWVGEEIRAIGGEARLEWRGDAQSIEGSAAVVRSNDPAGELLAARGWALSDITSGIGSLVREPDVYAVDNRQPVPLRFNPFMENDSHAGWYAGADWRATGRGRLTILRYDNEADPSKPQQWRVAGLQLAHGILELRRRGRARRYRAARPGHDRFDGGHLFAVFQHIHRLPRRIRARRLESRRVAAGGALRCVFDRAIAAKHRQSCARAWQCGDSRTQLAAARLVASDRRGFACLQLAQSAHPGRDCACANG
jgi:hypothetical protein